MSKFLHHDQFTELERSHVGYGLGGHMDSYVTSDPVLKSTYVRGSAAVEALQQEIWSDRMMHNRRDQVELIAKLPKAHRHASMNTLGWDMDRHKGYLRPAASRYTRHITSTIQDDTGHHIQYRKTDIGVSKDMPSPDKM